ncbi:MAG: phosphoribosylformylglycinamidine cyclo-ligase [Clostridiales bacterium]|nr:phosphoribosylformylglycinamidine cyclo-ligase [Clostridiales bacterium]
MGKDKHEKITYADAGVDVTRGYAAVEKIKSHAASTFNDKVLQGLGSFGGFYDISGESGDVLVAGTDGVGTKLKYAFLSGRNDTVGIDCVAMCVNDIICQGAKPLLFLDYIATGRIKPDTIADVVKGVAEGCRQAECALVGGETAEMPSMYAPGEYDLAGFSVGIVKRDRIINGSTITPGCALVGLASSGLHSNGFSLVRRLLGEDVEALEKDMSLGKKSLLDEILTPTHIYVKSALALAEKFDVLGYANITGGGFIENIPRIFPDRIGCKIDIKSFPRPAIFQLLAEKSNLAVNEIYNTFNMGIGMVACVRADVADSFVREANALGEKAYVIGETVSGEGVAL